MKKIYTVWSSEVGISKQDGFEVLATDVLDAVGRYGRMYRECFGEFLLGDGESIVCEAQAQDSDTVTSVKLSATYRWVADFVTTDTFNDKLTGADEGE